jgi:hypothetical protein
MTPATGRWALPLEVYGALGLLAGLGFMLGELPNSFVKRQLGITAGQPAPGRLTRPLFFVIDHIDSTCGVVAMLLLVVPVPAWTVAYVLAASLIVHTAFSRAAFHLGGKARAA